MKTELKKQFRKDNPQTIGETDSHFDLSNYNDWLENKYFELLKQNQEMRELLVNILKIENGDTIFPHSFLRDLKQKITKLLESTEVKP